MLFREILNLKRKEAGLSQKQLGKLANIHQGDISKIERGLRKPPQNLRQLKSLANAIGIKDFEELTLFVCAANISANRLPKNLSDDVKRKLPSFIITFW